jgi:ABC-type transport system involved in cytochrome c biogenesis ATPase subunit
VADLVGEHIGANGIVIAAVHHPLPIKAGGVTTLELGAS